MRIPTNHHTTATKTIQFPTNTLRAYTTSSTLVVVTPNKTHFFPFHHTYPHELFYSDQFYYQKDAKVFSKRTEVSDSIYLFTETLELVEAGFCLLFRANKSTFLFKHGGSSKFISLKDFKNPNFYLENEGELVNVICVFDCFVFYCNNEVLVVDGQFNLEYYEFKKKVVFIGYFKNRNCNNNTVNGDLERSGSILNSNETDTMTEEEIVEDINTMYNRIDKNISVNNKIRQISNNCINTPNEVKINNKFKNIDNSYRANIIDKIDENNFAIIGSKSMVITPNAININSESRGVNNNNYLVINDKLIFNKSVVNLLKLDEKRKLKTKKMDDKLVNSSQLGINNTNIIYKLRYGFKILELERVEKCKNRLKFETALTKQSNVKEFINRNLEWIKNECSEEEYNQYRNYASVEINEKNIAKIKNFDDFLLLKNLNREVDIQNNFSIFSKEKELFDIFYPRLHRQKITKVYPLIKDEVVFTANEEDMENRRDKAHKIMLSSRQSYLLKGETLDPKMPVNGFDGAVECALSIGVEIKGVFESKLGKNIFKLKSHANNKCVSSKKDCTFVDRSNDERNNTRTSKRLSVENLKKLDSEQQAGLIWGYAILNGGHETINNPGDDTYLQGIKKIAENFNTQNYVLASDLKEGEGERVSAIVAIGLSFRNTKNKVIFEHLKEQANFFGVLNKEWVTEESRILSAFSMYLTGHVEFTVLNDKLAELIYNGLAYFKSQNTAVKKRFFRSKEDRLEEVLYSSFFVLGVDFKFVNLPFEYCKKVRNQSKNYNINTDDSEDINFSFKTVNLSVDDIRMTDKQNFGGNKNSCGYGDTKEETYNDDLWTIHKKAGIYYYCGIYSVLNEEKYINEWDLLVDEIEELEKKSIKNKNFKVLFDASLVCASLIMNGSSNIRLLRILRRRIISYGDLNHINERIIFNGSYVTFYGNSYGDYLRYKLCVAVLCGRKLKKKLFEIFAAFYIEFPLEKSEQKFLRLFRHLMEGEGEINVIPNSLNEMGLGSIGLDYDLKVLVDNAAVRIENGEKVDLNRFGIFIDE